MAPAASFGGEAVSGLDQLKNRVVFTYGFMEMMFWLWVSPVLSKSMPSNWLIDPRDKIFVALRDERQQVTFRAVEAQ